VRGYGFCFSGASALSALAPPRSLGTCGGRAAGCCGHAAHGPQRLRGAASAIIIVIIIIIIVVVVVDCHRG
jgi:hypothetical protein